ncbi:MAG: hypothetical protein LBU50_05440 [Cellulomonas sp.]|jgi:hypothetical protein|nr:hypothetical protein [Cellulomonas sp.]
MAVLDPTPAAPARHGSGLLADGQALVVAIGNGSWVEGGLGAFAFTPGDGPDPLDALHQAGLGWLVPYLAPLPGWWADLRVDADQVRAFSQGWAGVARRLSVSAAQIDEAVVGDLSAAAGDAADAYRALTADVTGHVEGTATWAEGLASGLQTAVTVTDAVRRTVRDALGRAVGSVLTRSAEGWSGPVSPALVAHTTTVAAQAAQEVGAALTRLLGSLRTLGGLMDDLGGVMQRAQVLFDGVPEMGRRAFHEGLGQTHTPLPDVTDLPHPRDGGDLDTWAGTVAARHGTLTADQVVAVYRYTDDGSGAEPSAEPSAEPGAEPGAAPGRAVTETLSELARLPLADLRTVHTASLPEAATDTVRLGQQLPAWLLTPADDGNAQVHVDWHRRADPSALSHYRDEGARAGAYLEVVGRQWNPVERHWEISARQR